MEREIVLPYYSYCVFKAGTYQIEEILFSLRNLGIQSFRDVIIGNLGDDKIDLVGEKDDFWFHSDGVFYEHPPRWVLIQLLEVENGGAFEVLDTRELISHIENEIYFFGKKNIGLFSSVHKLINNALCFRYRRDFMLPSNNNIEKLNNLHLLIAEFAERRSNLINDFDQDACILIDNWTLLHRRNTFSGRRVIRRIWFN